MHADISSGGGLPGDTCHDAVRRMGTRKGHKRWTKAPVEGRGENESIILRTRNQNHVLIFTAQDGRLRTHSAIRRPSLGPGEGVFRSLPFPRGRYFIYCEAHLTPNLE